MASKLEAAACDDPRNVGYPCYQDHKQGPQRSNQHASWVTCTRCGLRLQYFPKKGKDGSFRQMGPEPHLIRLALKELEQTVDAPMVTANMVTGKTMEIKGKMLQMGVPTSMALTMTYEEYVHRLEKFGRADGKPIEVLPKAAPSPKKMAHKPRIEEVQDTPSAPSEAIPAALQQTIQAMEAKIKRELMENLSTKKEKGYPKVETVQEKDAVSVMSLQSSEDEAGGGLSSGKP